MGGTAIEIAGAGPAGLAAAITLAGAGRQVIVHETQGAVGYRFKRDLQGLDNWTTRQDALVELQKQGLTTGFKRLPCRAGNGVFVETTGCAGSCCLHHWTVIRVRAVPRVSPLTQSRYSTVTS